MISICSQQCNYSMKRQRFCCFMSFAQNADIHMSGKQRNSPIDTKWEDNYLYNGQPSTSCRTSIVIFFKQQFGFYIGTEGSVQFFWRIGNVIRCSRDSKCQARSGKPWTSTQEKDEMHTWAPTQGILVWWQPITVHLEDLEAYVPAHYSERVNSDSEGDASKKEETHKRKHSVHAYCRKKPKEFCSAIRKMVTWQQQSRKSSAKDVNLGTITETLSWYTFSPLSGIRVKPKTSQETEKNLRESTVTVAEAKRYSYVHFVGIWKVLWRIIVESSDNCTWSIRKKQICRVSCASSKRRDISRTIAICIGW